MDALNLSGVPAGARLRLRRVRLGLTQRALGEMTGLASSVVSDVESDTVPGRRTARQLAMAAEKMDAALRPLERRWRRSVEGGLQIL